jgi:hypothetical protein
VVNAKFEKILNAIIDQLPHILVAAIAAIIVLIWGLWITTRDNASDIANLKSEYNTYTLCERLKSCPKCEEITKALRDIDIAINNSEHHIESHNNESEQWKQRIIRLENQIYEMQTMPKARPDPFTGSMGRELEKRLQKLEELEYFEHQPQSHK